MTTQNPTKIKYPKDTSTDCWIPKFEEKNVDKEPSTYNFTIIHSHGLAKPYTYNLKRIQAAMKKQTGSIQTAFRVVHLKNSICKFMGLPFGSINIIFKGKIIQDKDNLFNVGIVDGARLHVILKTESRKDYELKEMNAQSSTKSSSNGTNAGKYLPADQRGQEKLPEPSPREKEYMRNNFGLSDKKLCMLIDTMFNNPILIQRYSENAMIQRLIDDPAIRNEKDEILQYSPFWKEILKEDERLDNILSGKDSEGLEKCKEFIKDTNNIKKVTSAVDASANSIRDLCKHIAEPQKFKNPVPKNSEGKFDLTLLKDQNRLNSNASTSAEWEIENDDANAMFDDNVDDMIYEDGDEQTKNNDANSTSNYIPNVRADLKIVWKHYKTQFEHMKDMGLENDAKILELLKEYKGDLNECLEEYYS